MKTPKLALDYPVDILILLYISSYCWYCL